MERGVIAPFAPTRHGRRHERDPHILRSLHLLAVVPPVGSRPAAAVIGRDEDVRAIAVVGLRLDPCPQLLEKGVGPRERLEDAIVAAVVGPVVGLAERDVHDARAGALQVGHRQPERVDVVADGIPRGRRLELQRAQLAHLRVRMLERLKSRVDGEGAARVLDDGVEHVPRPEHADAGRRQSQPGLQFLEHRYVRIAQGIVALDGVVVRLAEEDLRVAGVREAMRVREGDGAPRRLVARDRAVTDHQRPPEKRHHLLAARRRRVRPEPAVRGLLLERLALPERGREGDGIEAAEHFLHTRTVERDQDDAVARRALLDEAGPVRTMNTSVSSVTNDRVMRDQYISRVTITIAGPGPLLPVGSRGSGNTKAPELLISCSQLRA